MPSPRDFIALAVFLAVAVLLCIGGAIPNIDGPLFEAAERRTYGIAFAILGTLAIVSYQRAKDISARRIAIEAVFNFMVLLCVGLVFNP